MFISVVFVINSTTTEAYDTEKMAIQFLMQFPRQAFTVGQQLVFSFEEKKILSLVVKELEGNFLLNRWKSVWGVDKWFYK